MTFKIFKNTLPFMFIKLGILAAEALLLIGTLVGIIALSISKENGGIAFFGVIGWIVMARVVTTLVNNYGMYLIKAGQVAYIADAVNTGAPREKAVSYGVERVKSKFVSAAAFSVVDKLISGSVSQIQKKITNIGEKLSFIPGMKYITFVVNLFLNSFLGFIDECCLGYIFLHDEIGQFHGACDSIVYYVQNWKSLAKGAGKVTLINIGYYLGLVIAAYSCACLAATELGFYVVFGVIAGIFWCVKKAVLDNLILIIIMNSYVKAVNTSELKVDLYGKLEKLSTKFKTLVDKWKEEGDAPAVVQPSVAEELGI